MKLNSISLNFAGRYLISGNLKAQEELTKKLQDTYDAENLSIQTISTPARIATSSTMTIVKTNQDAKEETKDIKQEPKVTKPLIADYMRALCTARIIDNRYELKDAFIANYEFDNNLFDTADDSIESFRYRGMKYTKSFDGITRVYNKNGELVSKFDENENEIPLSEYETEKNKFSLNNILFNKSTKRDISPLHGARTIFSGNKEYRFDKDGTITIFGKTAAKTKLLANGDIVIFKNGKPDRILQPDGTTNPIETTFSKLNKAQKRAAKSLVESISWKLSPKTRQAQGISAKFADTKLDEVLEKINSGKKLSELSQEEIKIYKSFLSYAWKISGTNERKAAYRSACEILKQYLNGGIDAVDNSSKDYIASWIEKNPDRYETLKTASDKI